MAKLKFEAASSLSVEEARQRVLALLDYWGRKYGVRSAWPQELRATMSGKAMGVTIDGTLEVRGDKVSGEAADPGFLMRGPALAYLTRKFTQYLDPKKTLDELKKAE